MSQDPLQHLWQSHQLNFNVNDILHQAKAKQRRMFWFMALDLLIWLIVVTAASWYIHQSAMPGAFAIGLFSIIFCSLLAGYLLWLRTSTWGIDSLDVRNVLALSIRRCQAGIQLSWVSMLMCILVSIVIIGFCHFYAEYFSQTLLFAYAWSLGWCIAYASFYLWYKRKQRLKIQHFQTLLAQFDDNRQEKDV